MDETVLLVSLALFLLLAAVCSIVFNKIRLPPLIGYLMAGIIVANFVSISEEQMDVVDILSDMGLTMLMFCIGLEINLKKLRKQGVFAMKVAMVEIPFMVLAGYSADCSGWTRSRACAWVRSWPAPAPPWCSEC